MIYFFARCQVWIKKGKEEKKVYKMYRHKKVNQVSINSVMFFRLTGYRSKFSGSKIILKYSVRDIINTLANLILCVINPWKSRQPHIKKIPTSDTLRFAFIQCYYIRLNPSLNLDKSVLMNNNSLIQYYVINLHSQ